MHNRIIIIVLLISLCIANITWNKIFPKEEVLVIIPERHLSIDNAVESLKKKIAKSEFGSKIKIKVKNIKSNKSRIEKLMTTVNKNSKNYFSIITIGDFATEHTINYKNNDLPLIALGVSNRKLDLIKNYTGIIDTSESISDFSIAFLKSYKPDIKRILVPINSKTTSPEELNLLIEICDSYNIELITMEINNSGDIYNMFKKTKDINSENSMVYIMKNHSIIKNISSINREAKKNHLAIISSDEGSVRSKNGASFAIGTTEIDLGKLGASMLFQIMSGKKVTDIKYEHLRKLYVFINMKTATEQNIDIEDLSAIARRYGLMKVIN